MANNSKLNNSTEESKSTMEPQDKGDNIDLLIKSAGPRPIITDERSTRVFSAVNKAWKDSLKQKAMARRKRTINTAYGSCAAGFLIAIITFSLSSYMPQQNTVIVAHVLKIIGEKQFINDKEESIYLGMALHEGQELETLSGSSIAIELIAGQSIRIDQNTRFQFISANEIKLLSGAVYYDSDTISQVEAFRVYTSFGVVSDIGTQFEVRLTPNNLGISVREGIVNLKPTEGLPQRLNKAEKLVISDTGESTISHIAPDALEWRWTQSLAPAFELEGKSLDQFLTRFSRENGWKLNYKTRALHDYALQTQLHGSILDMTTEEILQTVAAIGDIHFELNDWVLYIQENDPTDSTGE